MKTVVLLCGDRNSGKTNTLKTFFGVSGIKRLRPMQLLKTTVNGKRVYAVGLTSPQELAKDFCKVEKVDKRINKRLGKCELDSQGQDYVLIIPFTLFVKNGNVNERCIIEPIESLRSKGYNVVPVYLKKATSTFLHLFDALMNKIRATTIESSKDYDGQAEELKKLIRDL
jgi:hypothetical protein